MRKLEDIVIYSDENFYSAFPSIVSRPDGELLVAFRRAPERRKYFATEHRHTDPNSYLVLVRSRDLGRTWTTEPELIYAHPMGGSQDPCMVQLDDGSLLVSSYAWMLVSKEGANYVKRKPGKDGWLFTSLGGYLMRSQDGGGTWQGPIIPPQLENQHSGFPGVPHPACSRGAMIQADDGNLYWSVTRSPKSKPWGFTMLELLISEDRGLSWNDAGPIAADDKITFNETSLIQTEKGDLLAFVRSEDFNDHGVIVRSKNMGKTWEPWQDMGIIGHPYHALKLPNQHIYLVYGYRHQPYGIRARVLDPEGTRFDTEEIILRDDGGSGDLGYAWSSLTADGRVLSVYYFNQKDGVRHIGGTFLEID